MSEINKETPKVTETGLSTHNVSLQPLRTDDWDSFVYSNVASYAHMSMLGETEIVDWTDRHVGDWDRVCQFMEKRGMRRVLEVGCFDGTTTELLARIVPQVSAVDINVRPKLKSRINKFPNIQFHRGTLFSALPHLMKGEKFDVIYIDGSHIARDALLDMVTAWELLRVGGILICDDYGWVDDEHTRKIVPKQYVEETFSAAEFTHYFNVKAAVDAFESCQSEARTLQKGREWAVFEKVRRINDDIRYAADLNAALRGEVVEEDFIYGDKDKQAHYK